MQITYSNRLLVLISNTLETLIFPEVHSDRARATADIVRAVLADLIKRDKQTPAFLAEINVAGRALAKEMSTVLRVSLRESNELDEPQSAPCSQTNARLDILIEEHAVLTKVIAELSCALQQSVASSVEGDQTTAAAILLKAAQWELSFGSRQRAFSVSTEDCPRPELAPGSLTRENLESFMRASHPDGSAVHLLDFESVPGGFGKQTTRFSIRNGSGHEQSLIARKMDRAPLMTTGMFSIDREFHLLRCISATGYPAPRPLYMGLNVPGVDANFYVMERLPGAVPGSYLGGMHGDASESLVLDIAAQLARLHAIPLEALSKYVERFESAMSPNSTVSNCYSEKLSVLRRYHLQDEEHLPSPYLIYVADWLQRNLPTDERRPVLVHGDFNIHNLLVTEQRVSGVLDWECALFGAPEQDLAYIQPHVSKLIEWEKFLAHYETCSGRAVDRDRLSYYLTFSMFIVSIAMNRGVRNLQTGANNDIRYAMIELAFATQFMEMGIRGTLS